MGGCAERGGVWGEGGRNVFLVLKLLRHTYFETHHCASWDFMASAPAISMSALLGWRAAYVHTLTFSVPGLCLQGTE